MTDLESACRKLVEEWRHTENVLEANEPEQYGREECAVELQEVLEEHTPDAADRLAEQTGEPRERFEADDKPIPDLDDLNSEVKELVDTMEDAT